MKSRLFLIPVVILGLALLSSFSVPVAAAAPTVKLVVGGSGATGWNISGIKPGASGTQPITVMNSGTETGDLTIWVSNIVNTEGTNPKFESSPAAEIWVITLLFQSYPAASAAISLCLHWLIVCPKMRAIATISGYHLWLPVKQSLLTGIGVCLPAPAILSRETLYLLP